MCNAIAIAIEESNKNKALDNDIKMAHLSEADIEKGSLNRGTLKVISGNDTKQLRTRQKTWGTNKANKNAATSTPEMAVQEYREVLHAGMEA